MALAHTLLVDRFRVKNVHVESTKRTLVEPGAKTVAWGYLQYKMAPCPSEIVVPKVGIYSLRLIQMYLEWGLFFNLTWYLLFPVTCAAGNFFDVLKHQCLPCPVGTYQPTTGLNFCYACPVSTSTDFVGSTNQSDCKSELYYQRCIFFICLKFSPHTDCYRTFRRTNYCSILPLLANVSSFYTIYIKYLDNLNLFTLTS